MTLGVQTLELYTATARRKEATTIDASQRDSKNAPSTGLVIAWEAHM